MKNIWKTILSLLKKKADAFAEDARQVIESIESIQATISETTSPTSPGGKKVTLAEALATLVTVRSEIGLLKPKLRKYLK